MKAGRVTALLVGCLFLLPGLGMLAGGGVLGIAYALARDDDGYVDVTLDPLRSSTAAITAEDVDVLVDAGSPDWLLDRLDADLRLRVTATDGRAVFVGIGPTGDVRAYLAGVARHQVTGTDGTTPAYRSHDGSGTAGPPAEQTFWSESATGTGTRELEWEATDGRWSAVLMNADATPGVSADVTVGGKAGFVTPLALILVGVGALTVLVSVVLIVVGITGPRAGIPAQQTGTAATAVGATRPDAPVAVRAELDPALSRWLWLVKWVLAIPHFVVLVFLWAAFAVLTIVAGVAILVTGRYPRAIFDFNVGVLRWSWRVSYYASSGGIGTDRYPPFSLGAEPGYPATLDVRYPERLSRGLVLVKWWLLALPHYVVIGLLLGSWMRWEGTEDWVVDIPPGGLLGLLVLVAGVVLLFSGRYPRPLFDLVVGFNRWVYRVVAYAALMTDRYPPFRLDQGGDEPRPPVEPDPLPFPTDPALQEAGRR